MSYLYLGYTVTRWSPWMVTLVISAASIGRSGDGSWRWGKEFILVTYNLWLCVLQLFIYIVQYGLKITHLDPYDLTTQVYTFPSSETFYIFSLVTYVVGFTFLWQIELQWAPYFMLFLLAFAIPNVFYLFELCTVFELVASAVAGIAGTLVFLLVMRFIVVHHMPMLITMKPWVWLSCVDSHMMNKAEQLESVRIRAARLG